jgi:hypothetical protein
VVDARPGSLIRNCWEPQRAYSLHFRKVFRLFSRRKAWFEFCNCATEPNFAKVSALKLVAGGRWCLLEHGWQLTMVD